MMDWSPDRWIGIVGTVLAVISLGIVWFQRRPNTLDYELLLLVGLLSKHASGFGELAVTYTGSRMKNPYLVRTRIGNSGKHAVRRVDYVDAITIDIEGAEVYDVVVTSQSVPNLIETSEERFHLDGGRITSQFRPQLMNPGDWFEVQQLCEGKPTNVTVSARYADQSRPMGELQQLADRIRARFALLIFAITGGVSLVVGAATSFEGRAWSIPVLVVVSGLAGWVFLATMFEAFDQVITTRSERKAKRQNSLVEAYERAKSTDS